MSAALTAAIKSDTVVPVNSAVAVLSVALPASVALIVKVSPLLNTVLVEVI